jgi:hypothetical protein
MAGPNILLFFRGNIIFDVLTEVVTKNIVFWERADYVLDDRGVGIQLPVGARIFSSSRLWGPPSFFLRR